MNISPKAQRVIDWRESMAILNDDFFFEIARMYLGEIKTPFNKTDLIERISAFLRKEENKAKIISLLSNQDLKILLLVKTIPSCTRENILSFLKEEEKNSAIIFQQILNLEERLLLFSFSDKKNRTESIRINPLLENEIFPLLEKNILFPPSNTEDLKSSEDYISPSFLAAYTSFVLTHSDLLKNDGSLKKHATKEAQEIFADKAGIIELLSKAFLNLQLIHQNDKGVFADYERLELFAKKKELEQVLYIATAAAGHFSRRELQSRTQNLFDTLNALPPYGISLKNISKLSLLLKMEKSEGGIDFPSRFSLLMQKHSEDQDLQDSGIMEYIAENANALGLLVPCGKNSQGEPLYLANKKILSATSITPPAEKKKCLSIDAGFSITIMPSLSLTQLLPLMLFLDIKHYDTAAVFEINRKSVIRAFDRGLQCKDITKELEKNSDFSLPQNLVFSLDEWQSSYNSATLYKGYVLKIKEEHAARIKKSPSIAKKIQEELAPGVFLFNFESDDEAEQVLSKIGLDYIGKVRQAENQAQPADLPVLNLILPLGRENKEEAKYKPVSEKAQDDFLEAMKKNLEGMKMSQDQKEGLLNRIDRKVVINENQLVASSVRFEKLEAGGLDYAGKIHVAENALSSNVYLEITVSDRPLPFVCRPKALSKKPGEAEITIVTEDSQQEETIPIKAIVHIKRLRFRT